MSQSRGDCFAQDTRSCFGQGTAFLFLGWGNWQLATVLSRGRPGQRFCERRHGTAPAAYPERSPCKTETAFCVLQGLRSFPSARASDAAGSLFQPEHPMPRAASFSRSFRRRGLLPSYHQRRQRLWRHLRLNISLNRSTSMRFGRPWLGLCWGGR